MRAGKSRWLVFVAAVAVVLLAAFSASAVTYDYGDEKKLYVTGYLESHVGVGMGDEPSYNAAAGQYMTSGNTNGVNQVLMTGYVETQLKWGRDLEFRTAWRLQGDQVDDFRESERWKNTYGMADDNLNFDDDIDDVVREFNVAYFGEYFNCRLGKQQLVWGEVDGLRIMDQINPLDLRRGFIFYDSDAGFTDSRVPLWMLKTELTTGMDFEYKGLSSVGLELTWIPDVDPWNRFEIGPREGGTYAYPVPDGYYLGPGLGLRQLNVHRETPDRTVDHSSFATRMKCSFLESFITLNYFYGWSADGYLAQNPQLGAAGYGLNIWTGATGNVGDGPGLVFDTILKTYRQKTAGFTFSRQLGFFQPLMKLMGQFDQPIMRIEALYQFDKKYNVSNPLLDAAGLPPAFNLVLQPPVGPPSKYVTASDEIRWMVGLDWFALRIPWINTKNKVTLSGQFINYHIMDHENTMYQGPYNWHLEKDFYAWSLLVGTAYWKEKIRPQIIYVRDATYNSFFVKPRVQVDLGDNWRTEVGAYLVEGANEEKQFGLYDNRDSVYMKIKYQF